MPTGRLRASAETKVLDARVGSPAVPSWDAFRRRQEVCVSCGAVSPLAAQGAAPDTSCSRRDARSSKRSGEYERRSLHLVRLRRLQQDPEPLDVLARVAGGKRDAVVTRTAPRSGIAAASNAVGQVRTFQR